MGEMFKNNGNMKIVYSEILKSGIKKCYDSYKLKHGKIQNTNFWHAKHYIGSLPFTKSVKENDKKKKKLRFHWRFLETTAPELVYL